MQSTAPLLHRRRARDEVRDLLRGMILDGSLPAASRLEEVELSERIGVSRTPFREALIALEEEGLVESRPNKGFMVTPINEALVREIFPVLGVLEAGAVRLGGERLVAAAGELRTINARLAKETRRAAQYDLDAAFHRRLVSDCGAPRLIRLWEQHWTQAQRVNGAHDRGTADREGSCADHAAIVTHLAKGRVEEAARRLEAHWASGEQIVIAWLRSRP